MRVVSGKKSAVKKSNEPRGVRVWRTRVLWRACVFQFVCVCVCVSRIHCHAHASATVWRHKGGVLVNGILVGAPRRRRGEQHVEKGSCRGDVRPRGTLHPFASLSANLALGRLKSAHGLPLSVFLSPPRITSHPSAARNWMNVASRRSIFDTPFKEKYGSGKVWMGEMYLSAEDFERGDSSAAVFMKKKKEKTLLYSMMSKIRQIVWYLKEKTFFVIQKRLQTYISWYRQSFKKKWEKFRERNSYPSVKLAS